MARRHRVLGQMSEPIYREALSMRQSQSDPVATNVIERFSLEKYRWFGTASHERRPQFFHGFSAGPLPPGGPSPSSTESFDAHRQLPTRVVDSFGSRRYSPCKI